MLSCVAEAECSSDGTQLQPRGGGGLEEEEAAEHCWSAGQVAEMRVGRILAGGRAGRGRERRGEGGGVEGWCARMG